VDNHAGCDVVHAVSELVTNAVRHARGTTWVLSLDAHSDAIDVALLDSDRAPGPGTHRTGSSIGRWSTAWPRPSPWSGSPAARRSVLSCPDSLTSRQCQSLPLRAPDIGAEEELKNRREESRRSRKTGLPGMLQKLSSAPGLKC
jgi:hypothetical protein